MSKNTVYIGVAGLLAEHVWEVASFYEILVSKMKRPPFLFLGMQTSRKKLNSELVNPVYSGRMNSFGQISEATDLVQKFNFCKLIVHYNPSGGYYLDGACEHVLRIKNMEVDGIQWNGLNIIEPNPDGDPYTHLLNMNELGLFSILQIGAKDYEDIENFVQEIQDPFFQTTASHLLFEGSSGRGIPLDEDKVVEWIKALRRSNNNLGIAISGGIGIDSLNILTRIRGRLGYQESISIDAEGKLMDDFHFSPDKAKKFLAEALKYY